MPFSLEGFAFFTEAIFLGVYLYGWDGSRRARTARPGIVVAVERRAVGRLRRDGERVDEHARRLRDRRDGQLVDDRSDRRHVQPVAFAAGAAHAARGVRGDGLARRRHPRVRAAARAPTSAFHRRALAIALARRRSRRRCCSRSSGDLSARSGRAHAAGQARRAGGAVRDRARRAAAHRRLARRDAATTRYAHRDSRRALAARLPRSDAEVNGLDAVPARLAADRAGASRAFRSWSALGTRRWRSCARGLLSRAGAGGASTRRATLAARRWSSSAPLGFIAIEAGWTVTEVGRQPWVVYGVLRTADAVTPMPGLVVPFVVLHRCSTSASARSSSCSSCDRSVEEPAERAVTSIGLPRDRRRRSCCVALTPTCCSAAPTSAAACGICSPRGPRRDAQRELIAHAIAPDLGGEPRLADPRRGRGVHRVPGRVRGGQHVLHVPLRSCSSASCCAARRSCSGRTGRTTRATAALGPCLRHRQQRHAAVPRRHRRGGDRGRLPDEPVVRSWPFI